jgi:hypothetical protein
METTTHSRRGWSARTAAVLALVGTLVLGASAAFALGGPKFVPDRQASSFLIDRVDFNNSGMTADLAIYPVTQPSTLAFSASLSVRNNAAVTGKHVAKVHCSLVAAGATERTLASFDNVVKGDPPVPGGAYETVPVSMNTVVIGSAGEHVKLRCSAENAAHVILYGGQLVITKVSSVTRVAV